MVSGGFVASEYKDTSEIWTGSEWRFTTGKLPYTARDVKMAFIDNRILYLGIKAQNIHIITHLKGGWDGATKRKSILSFSLETEAWTEEGDMLDGRSAHGISVVNVNDYKKWCNACTDK